MFLLLATLITLIDGCVRTSDTVTTTTASSVTTTTVTSADTTTTISTETTTTTPTTTSTTTSTSTTTTSTTTTTTIADCTICDPTIVALEPDPDPVNGHPPTSALGPPDAGSGCATLIVTCTAQPPNTVSLLTFFSATDDLGQAAIGDPAIGMLLCNSNGDWIYTGAVNPEMNAVIRAECLG